MLNERISHLQFLIPKHIYKLGILVLTEQVISLKSVNWLSTAIPGETLKLNVCGKIKNTII